MVKATKKDYPLVIQILADAFETNQSVNYIVCQDRNRRERIKNLITYSVKVCQAFGEIFLSDDRKACALVLYPEKKKTTLSSLLWDAQLLLTCTGVGNVKRVLNRENLIKKRHPKERFVHLWYIGLLPKDQFQGTGSRLLQEISQWAAQLGRPVYLETSTVSNLSFYKKAGYQVFDQIDLSYNLFFLSNAAQVTTVSSGSAQSTLPIQDGTTILGQRIH